MPTITRLEATLGAVVTDVELAALAPDGWRAIEDAFHAHALLIFPGQHLAPEAQVDFARRFGEIERLTPDERMLAVPLSNARPDGSLLGDDDDFFQILRGNEGWHTDSSYMPLAAKASVLSARVLPSRGGETEWADMRAAWDSLDDATRERVSGLSAYHSLYHSQAKIGHAARQGSSYGFHGEGAPLRPLVKVHPVTGRRALYIGRHAHAIPGLASEASERLLDELLDFACRPPRVHRHAWQVGDVVVWDNRAVLHRARPYDTREPRTMLHTRVAGDPRSEHAATDATRH